MGHRRATLHAGRNKTGSSWLSSKIVWGKRAPQGNLMPWHRNGNSTKRRAAKKPKNYIADTKLQAITVLGESTRQLISRPTN